MTWPLGNMLDTIGNGHVPKCSPKAKGVSLAHLEERQLKHKVLQVVFTGTRTAEKIDNS